jgi:putative transposase
VRFDPFDAGIAYAFVKGRWLRCISEHYARFAGRSAREIQLATAALRRRHQRHGQQFSMSARKLAEFLVSLEAEEVLLEQRLRDTALREVLAHRQPATQVSSNDQPPADSVAASMAPRSGSDPATDRGDTAAPVIYGDY